MELDGRRGKEVRERALESLKLVEMDHRRNHLPGALSGGEQQRVAIARALAIKPALLLADEPTGNLDSRQAGRVIELLGGLVEEFQQSIVMVTHDPAVARASHRLVTIRDGKIEDDGDAQSVLERNSLALTRGER
jgi:putative ABC transport system ATP-binding protein